MENLLKRIAAKAKELTGEDVVLAVRFATTEAQHGRPAWYVDVPVKGGRRRQFASSRGNTMEQAIRALAASLDVR